MAKTAEEYEAEIASLRLQIEQLQAAPMATVVSGAMTRVSSGLENLTITGIEELVLLVTAEDTVGYVNGAMAKVLGIEDRPAVVGSPYAHWDSGPLGDGVFRALVQMARQRDGAIALERQCPDVGAELLPGGGARAPGDPTILSFVARDEQGRVQIIAQDVTRLRWLERTFGRYVSPAVIEGMQHTSSDAFLGMVRRDVTIMFGDLRGFTKVSQKLAPEGVEELINAFVTEAVEVIEALDGTVSSIEGDGIMAFFGAPVVQPDHALRGLVCAVELQRRHQQWRQERAAKSLPAPELGLGVGVVGNIGTHSRVQYTCVGHPVNVTARLCGAAKGGQVLATPALHQSALSVLDDYTGAIAVPRMRFSSQGKMSFKNVEEPVDVIEITTQS